MENVQTAVVEELQQVAELRGLSLPSTSARQHLIDDLGLKSLDLAHLVAALERRLRVDPFIKHVPITQIRTIGDLCAAYTCALSEPK
ncbi:MAG TPA: acyl carrier protein [Pirellulales bacterium]|jgi:acyl carrier protein|nr:acyl carrier protein [Pirellulales bacterium]